MRYFIILFCAIMLIAGGFFERVPAYAQSTPPSVNFGRSCFNVIDFGADPTGGHASATLLAFQHAFAAASIINGAAVCAPAGTYELDGDVTLFSATTAGRSPYARQGGPSFFGAGPGLTVLRTIASGNLFDSCPSFSNVLPLGFVKPTPCPSVVPTPPPSSMSTPNPNKYTRLDGIVFANFSIVHGTPSVGNNFSDFNFPEISSLLVDNVCDFGATNVFDLGDQFASATWGPVTIKDSSKSSCAFQFSSHFIAVHGGGGGLIVQNNLLQAGGIGIVFDSSDMSEVSSGSSGVMSWVDNIMQEPFVGMFLFIGDDLANPFSPGAPGIQDSQWRGNEFDNCVLSCYYFGVDQGVSAMVGPPTFGHITMADKMASSEYDSIFFNGGSYSVGGVEGIQIGGPSSYSGSGGTANSLLMLRGSPAPGSGDGVYVFWNTSSVSWSTAPPSGVTSMALIASSLSTEINAGSAPSPTAQVGQLANSSYALIDLALRTRPSVGTYNAFPILVGTTGTIQANGLQPSSSCPTLPGGGTATNCYSAAFDIGDGVALRNFAHDIDIVGARVTSPGGAAIHVWQDGGNVFHFLSNILGVDQQITSHTGVRLEAPISNPATDYQIAGNDVVGATNGIVNALPTPTFTGNGTLPAIRTHRGAAGVNVSPSSSTITFTLGNSGPTDCTYYFDWTATVGHLLTLELLYPAAALTAPAQLSVSPPPAQIALPVGAELFVNLGPGVPSPGVVYTGLCQP